MARPEFEALRAQGWQIGRTVQIRGEGGSAEPGGYVPPGSPYWQVRLISPAARTIFGRGCSREAAEDDALEAAKKLIEDSLGR
jgi:hypothetical protein